MKEVFSDCHVYWIMYFIKYGLLLLLLLLLLNRIQAASLSRLPSRMETTIRSWSAFEAMMTFDRFDGNLFFFKLRKSFKAFRQIHSALVGRKTQRGPFTRRFAVRCSLRIAALLSSFGATQFHLKSGSDDKDTCPSIALFWSEEEQKNLLGESSRFETFSRFCVVKSTQSSFLSQMVLLIWFLSFMSLIMHKRLQGHSSGV